MKSNDPAFPHAIMGIPEDFSGLSKREYIAIKAMASIIESGETPWRITYKHDLDGYEEIAKGAYKFADAMIKASQND